MGFLQKNFKIKNQLASWNMAEKYSILQKFTFDIGISMFVFDISV